MIHLGGPAGSQTSQPDLTAGYKASVKTGSFLYNYFVTGETNKAVVSFPVDTHIIPVKRTFLTNLVEQFFNPKGKIQVHLNFLAFLSITGS
jgi:hypothetical protein